MAKFILFSLGSVALAACYAFVGGAASTRPMAPRAANSAEGDELFASGVVEGRTEAIELRPEAAGRVREVNVHVGDWVEPGQALLELDDRAEQAKVAGALANLKLAEAKLARLVNGARDCEREEARAVLASKQVRLRQAQLNWQRVQKLRAQNAVPQQEADDQDAAVQSSAAEVEAAQARSTLLEAPAREDELAAARASVAAAQAEYDSAKVAADRMSLTARSKAQVLDVNVEPGEMISPESNLPVLVLTDTSQLRVRAFVEEIDAPRVAIGSQAKITADGLRGHVFQGVVTVLSPQMKAKERDSGRPNELFDSKVREVLIDVAPGDSQAGLVIGLRVNVELAAASGGKNVK
jgi:multidrug resistance efflux pump